MSEHAPERQRLLREVANERLTEVSFPGRAGGDGGEFFRLAELLDESKILRRQPRAQLRLQCSDPLLQRILLWVPSVHIAASPSAGRLGAQAMPLRPRDH